MEPIKLTHRGGSVTFHPNHIVSISPNGGSGTNVLLITRESTVVEEPFELVDQLWRAALRGTQITSSGFGETVIIPMTPPETPETPTPAETPSATGPSARSKHQQPTETK